MSAPVRYVGYASLPHGRCAVTLEWHGTRARCESTTPELARAMCITLLGLEPEIAAVPEAVHVTEFPQKRATSRLPSVSAVQWGRAPGSIHKGRNRGVSGRVVA